VADIIDDLSNNALVSTLAGAAILALCAWAWRAWRNKRDGDLIVRFLTSSSKGTAFTFRSTQAIAANTRLSEGRVAFLCAGHKKVRRNEKEMQSWRLVQ